MPRTYKPEEYLELLLHKLGMFAEKNMNLTPEQSKQLVRDTIEQLEKDGLSMDELIKNPDKNPEFFKTLISKLIETYIKTIVLPLVDKPKANLTDEDKLTLEAMPEPFKKLLNKMRADKGMEPLDPAELAKEKANQPQTTANPQQSSANASFNVVDGNGATVLTVQVNVTMPPVANRNNPPTMTVAAVERGGTDTLKELVETILDQTNSAYYSPTFQPPH